MDLIDRSEVQYKMLEILPESDSFEWYEQAKPDEVKELVDELYSIVLNVNRIDAHPVKHGTWERTDMFVKCSECGVELLDDAFFGIHVFDDGYMPFCPNCSAKMNGVK